MTRPKFSAVGGNVAPGTSPVERVTISNPSRSKYPGAVEQWDQLGSRDPRRNVPVRTEDDLAHDGAEDRGVMTSRRLPHDDVHGQRRPASHRVLLERVEPEPRDVDDEVAIGRFGREPPPLLQRELDLTYPPAERNAELRHCRRADGPVRIEPVAALEPYDRVHDAAVVNGYGIGWRRHRHRRRGRRVEIA